MLGWLFDNRVKIYAIFLLALILVLAFLAAIRATGLTVYEDGSWEFTIPVVQVDVDGCWPVMGCKVLSDYFPALDEEWLDSAEYKIGGPLVQDGTVVLSGFDHSVHWTKFYPESGKRYKETYWNCYHSLNLCFLRHDDRPLFYRVLPDFPPPGWELIFGPAEC